MLNLFSSKITLNPESHEFPIELIELCNRPGSKCTSLPLADIFINASVHAVFDCRLLSYANERFFLFIVVFFSCFPALLFII